MASSKESQLILLLEFYLKNLEIFGCCFEGLEEDWNMNEYNPIGTFSLNKKPKVKDNVKLIQGKVQDTLEEFLKQIKEKK